MVYLFSEYKKTNLIRGNIWETNEKHIRSKQYLTNKYFITVPVYEYIVLFRLLSTFSFFELVHLCATKSSVESIIEIKKSLQRDVLKWMKEQKKHT